MKFRNRKRPQAWGLSLFILYVSEWKLLFNFTKKKESRILNGIESSDRSVAEVAVERCEGARLDEAS